jgi:ATP-dependent Lhr-like helicase
LQRVGRAGHSLGAIPKGRLFPLTRDDLLECIALVRAVLARRLDTITIPREPLDVLAQQIVAAVAGEEMGEDELWNLCRRAYPYRSLTRDAFDRIIELLSDGFAPERGRRDALLHRDRVQGRLRPRRRARLTALTCGGAIAEVGSYRVVTEDDRRAVVGSVDEDFAVESSAGDVFVLGTSSWKIQRLRGNDMMVIDVPGATPTVPFWRGEGPGRTIELSEELSALRSELDARLDTTADGPTDAHARRIAAEAWLRDVAHVDGFGAAQAVDYATAQRNATGFLPSHTRILFERFFDETGGMQVVIHSPFGDRINRAWGLALRKRFCRTFDFELQASADDNGIVLSLGQQHSFPLADLAGMITPASGRHLLEQAVLAVPFFSSRWRWNTTRALAIRRFDRGRAVPPPLLRMRADDLLSAVFPAQTACLENVTGDIDIPDHPLVRQTVHDTLHEAMNLDGWLAVLERVHAGAIEIVSLDTREPSPFAHERLNANPYAFLDDAPLEERRARAISVRRTLPIETVRDLGRLEPEAIEQVKREAWPIVRDPDELHDALQSLVAIPDAAMSPWRAWADRLVAEGRATCWVASGQPARWIATERVPFARALWPDGDAEPPVSLPTGLRNEVAREEALAALARGWMEISGPITVPSLAALVALPAANLAVALATLEHQGIVLRGSFSPAESETEWCERGLLARIHRLTLEELRRRIRPVSVDTFVRHLVRHQHVHPEFRLRGARGVATVLGQLEGFEAPAADWERKLLAARLERYDPAWLDELASSGFARWGRLRPIARRPGEESGTTRGRPLRAFGRNVPITIFQRDHYAWIAPANSLEETHATETSCSTRARSVLRTLRSGGALFHGQLAHRTDLPLHELDDALGELAAHGLATSDGFEPLRRLVGSSSAALIVEASGDPSIRRLLGRSRARSRRPTGAPRFGSPHRSTHHGDGRWSVLAEHDGETAGAATHRVEAWCRLLLRRYGLVCRDVLARESLAPPWAELARMYRVLEARGEIRGGLFVADLAGEQYALPEVVPTLRALAENGDDDPPLTVAATDPLNLFGRVVPGVKITASSANRVTIDNGRLANGTPSPRHELDPVPTGVGSTEGHERDPQ